MQFLQDFISQLTAVFSAHLFASATVIAFGALGIIDAARRLYSVYRLTHDPGARRLSIDTMTSMSPVVGWDEAPMPQKFNTVSPPKDAVSFSVFAPPSAPPGKTLLVQVFVHQPQQATHAFGMAKLSDSDTRSRGVQTLSIDVERGTDITIALSSSELVIDEPLQTIRWRGEPIFAQFLVTLPEGKSGAAYHVTARIAVHGALVGRIVFVLKAANSKWAPRAQPIGDDARRYEHAFLSYASADRKEVLKRAQALRAAGVSFFQDVLSLDPGDRWEREIYRHIDTCDLFLLFWSGEASKSQWVIREAEYALACQERTNNPDIVPVILEGPPVNLPPESLSGLHFNDRISYLIALS